MADAERRKHLVALVAERYREPFERGMAQLPVLEAEGGRPIDVEAAAAPLTGAQEEKSLTDGAVDIWQQGAIGGALQRLLEHHLVQQDRQGGVWLLPAYRQIVTALLPAASLTALHDEAAHQYSRRGQYTRAAYHYIQADQPATAIGLWREYQEAEINSGQAYAARQIFRPLLTALLDAPVKEALHLLCAHLEHLVGNLAQAQSDLQALLWRTPLLAVAADELTGAIANDQGATDAAHQAFTRGITTAEGLLEVRLARLHKGLGWQYLLRKTLDRAWHEAQVAA